MQKGLELRDWSIDTLKGFLVIAMVLSHTIQLLAAHNDPFLYDITQTINLFAFTGFLFAFGYACQLAYFQSDPIPYRRILRTAVKPIIAFYILALAFRLLPNHYLSTFRNILSILVFRDVAPFAEFLPAFSLEIILATLLAKPLAVILSKKWLFIGILVLLLMTTFIPYEVVTIRQVGLLIGSTAFAAYPILQYSPAFLIGMLFARHNIAADRRLIGLAVVGISIFGVFKIYQGWPSRFPPSLLWICGSLCLVYLLFLASRWIRRFGSIVVAALVPIGRNVLFYLVLSNFILFSLKAQFPEANLDLLSCLLLEMIILLCIQFCAMIVTPAPGSKPSSA